MEELNKDDYYEYDEDNYPFEEDSFDDFWMARGPTFPFENHRFITNCDAERVEQYEFIAAKKGISIKVAEAYIYDGKEGLVLITGLKSIHLILGFSSMHFFGYIWALKIIDSKGSSLLNEVQSNLADKHLPKSERFICH